MHVRGVTGAENPYEPTTLFKPIHGEIIYLYLAVSKEAISIVLVREEDHIQKPIYYISKRLIDA